MRANFLKQGAKERKATKESALKRFTGQLKKLRAAKGVDNEIRLKDGTLVVYDVLKAGGTIMTKDDMIPVPIGQGVYELIDKTRVYVGNGGVIIAVTPPKK